MFFTAAAFYCGKVLTREQVPLYSCEVPTGADNLLRIPVEIIQITTEGKADPTKADDGPGQIERGRLQRPHAHLRRRHLSPAGLSQELRVDEELDRFRPTFGGADLRLGFPPAIFLRLRPTRQRLERLQRLLTLLGGRVDGRRLLRRRLRVGLG